MSTLALRCATFVAIVLLIAGPWLVNRPSGARAEESLKQLTDTAVIDNSSPSISADGTRIAFWSFSQREIYVVNSDGTGLRRLVGAPLRAEGPPTISADGQWITFSAEAYSPQVDIYVMRTDGTGLRQITPVPRIGQPDDDYLRGYKGSPVISGDGSLVVFPSTADLTHQNGDGSQELFAVRSDGSGLRQITSSVDVTGPEEGSTTSRFSAFSPAVDHSGSIVAFLQSNELSRRDADGFLERYDWWLTASVVGSDGTGLRLLSIASDTLSRAQTRTEKLAMSGDGSRVAFPSDRNVSGPNPSNKYQLFTIKTDGSGLQQLTTPMHSDVRFPTLSFDGSRLAFVHLDPLLGQTDHMFEVYMVNADGSGLAALTTSPLLPDSLKGSGGAAMSADGSRLAFSTTADLLGRNADLNFEIFSRRLTSLLPVQGVRNGRTAADTAANRHSLVAGRDLVVRAFFDTGIGGATAGARGQLVVDEGTAQQTTFTVSGYTARPMGYFDDKPTARWLLENSLNFLITGQTVNMLLTSGAHSFRVRVDPNVVGSFDPWESSFTATFRQADTMDIFIVPVSVRDAAGALVAPDATLLPNAASFLRRTYPVDEDSNKVRNIILASLNLNQSPNTLAQQWALASQVRAILDAQLLYGAAANPARRHFAAGVLPYDVDGSNPVGGSILGYTFPSISGTVVSLDRTPANPVDPVIGSTIAHEVGHTLDLGDEYANGTVSSSNPPPATPAEGNSTGMFVLELAGGLDTTNRVAVFNRIGTAVYGYMGGGNDRNSWATMVDYSYLYTRLTTGSVALQSASTTSGLVVNVSGVITQAGGIHLNPVLTATSSSYAFARPTGTQYSLEFRDGGGTVLDVVGFDLDFSQEVRGVGRQAVEAVPFSFTTLLTDSVASLSVLSGTTPITTVTASPQPPTVTVIAPNGGESFQGSAQVRWQATDPDGDDLTYTVIYSPNGTDRYVVATGVTTTSLDLDFTGLPSGGQASIIVRASDGFNSAEDASDGPFVPRSGRVFLPLVLKGVTGQGD